jgi:hypothetical protein
VHTNCISYGGYVALAALSGEEGGWWQIKTTRFATKRLAVMAEDVNPTDRAERAARTASFFPKLYEESDKLSPS